MGIQGLWRYLENHNLSRHLGSDADRLEPEHLLLDMNSIMHKAYDLKRPTTDGTIEVVCKAVKTFVTKFPPRKSLTVAFDGVAPTAKIPTQRERRRKTLVGGPAAAAKGVELQQGQIVTGSVFVHKCQDAVIKLLQKLVGAGDIKASEGVLVSTYHSPGEGDTKIFKRLHALAAEAVEKGCYDPDDTVVIVGSDCDLVLGCAACTPYHNMFLMSPVTHLLTDIGALFTHWMKRSSGELVPLEMLPSLRIDFVFCVALSGGDHFNGLEERAIEIWRRYRHLRMDGGYFRRPLVMNGQFQLCWDLLTQIVSRDRKALLAHFVGSKNQKARKKAELAREAETGGSGDVQSGIDLLKGALWSVAAYAEGRPPAFDVKFLSSNPKPSSIRVACARGRQHVGVPRSEYKSLPPISVYLGAVGLKSLIPAPFDDIVSLPEHKNFSNLTSGQSILAHVRQMITTAVGEQNVDANGTVATANVTTTAASASAAPSSSTEHASPEAAKLTKAQMAEQLNRTEEDELLDRAIARAEAAAIQMQSGENNKKGKYNKKATITNTQKKKEEEARQRALALLAEAGYAEASEESCIIGVSSSNIKYAIPAEVLPLLKLSPENEWLAIRLNGPPVERPKPAASASTASSEPSAKVAVVEKKGGKKGGASTTSKVNNDKASSLYSAPYEDASFVAAAVAATSITPTLLKVAVVTPPGTLHVNPDTFSFTETMNTVDFKYPDYVTKVHISSVIVTRKPAEAAAAEGAKADDASHVDPTAAVDDCDDANSSDGDE